MLSSQWHMGECLINPLRLDEQFFVAGHPVCVFVKIPRLRKDGTLSQREYKTYVQGEIVRITPKGVCVEWNFFESVGGRSSLHDGSGWYRRADVYFSAKGGDICGSENR